MKEIENVLMRLKPVQILIDIANKDVIAHHLSIQNDITFSHVLTLLEKFRKAGLISMEKVGRSVVLTLTKKGLEVANKIKEIKKIFER